MTKDSQGKICTSPCTYNDVHYIGKLALPTDGSLYCVLRIQLVVPSLSALSELDTPFSNVDAI